MLSTAFLFIVILCVCVASVQVYGFYRFRSLRHLMITKKRFPTMVQLECVAVIIYLLFPVPCFSYEQLHGPFDDLFLYLLARIPMMTLLHFILEIEASRIWCMYFNLQFLHSSQKQRWKVLIDHSFAEKDWYLRNKETWGNARFVSKRVAVYYLFAIITYTISTVSYATMQKGQYLFLWDVLDAILFIAPLVLIVYTYCRSPDTNDNLFIQFEHRTTTITFCIGFIAYVGAIIVEAIGVDTNISYTLVSVATIFVMSVPSLLSTIYIPMKIQTSLIWVCSAMCYYRVVVHIETFCDTIHLIVPDQ